MRDGNASTHSHTTHTHTHLFLQVHFPTTIPTIKTLDTALEAWAPPSTFVPKAAASWPWFQWIPGDLGWHIKNWPDMIQATLLHCAPLVGRIWLLDSKGPLTTTNEIISDSSREAHLSNYLKKVASRSQPPSLILPPHLQLPIPELHNWKSSNCPAPSCDICQHPNQRSQTIDSSIGTKRWPSQSHRHRLLCLSTAVDTVDYNVLLICWQDRAGINGPVTAVIPVLPWHKNFE